MWPGMTLVITIAGMKAFFVLTIRFVHAVCSLLSSAWLILCHPTQFNVIFAVSVIGIILCCNCYFTPASELSGMSFSGLRVN